MNNANPTPRTEDIHIGKQIRNRRKTLGLTQSNLAASMGLAFQQIQKYETGKNRVSASRICDLSKILQVTPAYFFEGIGGRVTGCYPQNAQQRQMLEYMQAIQPKSLAALMNIARAIATATSQTTSHQILDPVGRISIADIKEYSSQCG